MSDLGSRRRICAFVVAACALALSLLVLIDCSSAGSANVPAEASADVSVDAAGDDASSSGDGGSIETDGGEAWVRFGNFVFVDHSSDVPDGAASADHFDLVRKEAPTPLFSAVEAASASAVTGYARVPAGVVTRFELRDSTKDPSATVPLAQSQAATLKPDARYTLFAMGSAYQGSDTVRLLLLEEAFAAPPSGSFSARYVAAMELGRPTDVNRFGTDGNVTYATVMPYTADIEKGVPIPTSATHLGVRLLAAAPSIGVAPPWFTAGAGDLRDGGRYFFVLAPLPCATRCLRASRDLGLFAIPADEPVEPPGAVIALRQDPRMYLLHMVLGGPEGLEVYSNGRKVATRVNPVSSDREPQTATLPPQAGGVSLSFVASGSGPPMLQDAPTGPLEAGKKYLGVLVGDATSVEEEKRPKLVVLGVSAQQQFLNAVSNAPSDVDLGYMSLIPDGGATPGDTFTPVVAGAAYRQRVEGISFNLPLDDFGFGFYAVRAVGEAAPPRVSRSSSPSRFLILFGDWNESLRLYYGNEVDSRFVTFPAP